MPWSCCWAGERWPTRHRLGDAGGRKPGRAVVDPGFAQVGRLDAMPVWARDGPEHNIKGRPLVTTRTSSRKAERRSLGRSVRQAASRAPCLARAFIVLKSTCQQLCFSVCRFLRSFPKLFHHASVSLPPTELSPSCFTVSHPSAMSTLPSPPPNGALPKPFPTVSCPSTMSTLPSRSLPQQLSPSYFPRFPVRPRYQHFRPAPSQAIFPIRPRCPRFCLAPSV